MKPSILLPLLLAATPATAQTRFETLRAGSTTDWITGSFLREHAQCRPALPNGSPGAAVPCTVYYLPPMPDAPPDSPYGQHLLRFEFSGQSVQLLLMPNSRNRLAYTPKPSKRKTTAGRISASPASEINPSVSTATPKCWATSTAGTISDQNKNEARQQAADNIHIRQSQPTQ